MVAPRSQKSGQLCLLIGLVGLLLFAHSRLVHAEETDSILVPPRCIDSLIWQNPDVVQFAIEAFGDSTLGSPDKWNISSATKITGERIDHVCVPDSTQTWWKFSPDSSMALAVTPSGDEPDNDFFICGYGGKGVMTRLEFCGTPCHYLGAEWIDNRSFVFLQVHEHYPDSTWTPDDKYVPLLQLYRLDVDSVYRYHASPIAWSQQGHGHDGR